MTPAKRRKRITVTPGIDPDTVADLDNAEEATAAKRSLVRKLRKKITDYAVHKAVAKTNDSAARELSPDIMRMMDELGEKKHVVVLDKSAEHPVSITATIVAGQTTSTDWAKFRKKHGAAIWQKITTRQVDSALVDKAINDGIITVEDIAEFSTIVDIAPYIKVTTTGTVTPDV